MRLVIGTNVFIEIISEKNRFHSLFKALLNGQFQLFVSNEILLEYEEVIQKKCKPESLELFLSFLDTSPFVHKITPNFKFNLITTDPDDNKFVDCAIAANSDYLVTGDRHFKVVIENQFPKVKIITPQNFIRNFLQ